MRKMSTYEEKKALLVLHNLLNFNLEDWETADRPDLQNKTASWGIEVVRDLYPKEIESEKHIKSVWNLPYSKWPKKKLKILSKNKVKLNIANDALQSASLGETTNTPDHVIDTIKEKIDLLNKRQYYSLDRYDLYVEVDTTCIDINHKSHVAKIIEEIVEYQNQNDLKYKMLYLVHHYVLCACDLDSGTFSHIAISRKLQEGILKSINTLN